MSRNTAFIVGAFGASGSGKSAFVKQALAACPPRLMVWDPMDEYGKQARRCAGLTALVQAVQGKDTFALRYVPDGSPDQLRARFDLFCNLAFALGNVAIVVEELQQVTTPSWAPGGWSNVTLRGRHKGLRVFGISQRPASVDKNFFSNATLIRCGRLNFSDDVVTMDRVLNLAEARPSIGGLSFQSVRALKPLEYVQRDMASGDVSAGVMTFDQRPTSKKKSEGAKANRAA